MALVGALLVTTVLGSCEDDDKYDDDENIFHYSSRAKEEFLIQFVKKKKIVCKEKMARETRRELSYVCGNENTGMIKLNLSELRARLEYGNENDN